MPYEVQGLWIAAPASEHLRVQLIRPLALVWCKMLSLFVALLILNDESVILF